MLFSVKKRFFYAEQEVLDFFVSKYCILSTN